MLLVLVYSVAEAWVAVWVEVSTLAEIGVSDAVTVLGVDVEALLRQQSPHRHSRYQIRERRLFYASSFSASALRHCRLPIY